MTEAQNNRPEFHAHTHHLLPLIDAQPWSTVLSRRVQHYGYRYDYTVREVSRSNYLGPLPDWLAEIADGLVADGHFDQTPDQVIIKTTNKKACPFCLEQRHPMLACPPQPRRRLKHG